LLIAFWFVLVQIVWWCYFVVVDIIVLSICALVVGSGRQLHLRRFKKKRGNLQCLVTTKTHFDL
jgi:hypothetical protein